MCAGVLLHRFATVDEYDLHGRGREIPVVGWLMAAGALLLAAVPPFTTFMGKSLLEEGSLAAGFGWLVAVFILVSALTGGAVLRVAGRVFLGWGPKRGAACGPGTGSRRAAAETTGPRDHTPPLMVLVPALLLVAVLVLGLIPGAVPGVERFAAQFVTHRDYAAWVLHYQHVPLPVLPASQSASRTMCYGAISVVGAWRQPAWGCSAARCEHASPG